MQEHIILIVFFLICAGQVWALIRGRSTAVAYYLCVFPLQYFSFWKYVTWGPSRVCGILLLLWGMLFYGRPAGIPRFTHHVFFMFVLYVIGLTIIGATFWPVESMYGRSSAYGSLRVIIQLINWVIMVGVAWQIAIVLSVSRSFEKIRDIVIFTGVLHSFYALYQVLAFYADLPVTGIRRPYSAIGSGYGYMQFGIDRYLGTVLYRVNSLVGEPKSFGVISLIWISLTLTHFLEGKRSTWLFIKFFLFFLVLFLTYSTVAMTGAVFAVLLALVISSTYNKMSANRLIVLILIFCCSFLYIDSLNLFTLGKGSFVQILLDRTTKSWSSVYHMGLNDLPEIEAKKILFQKPYLILLGTGLGGISLFIAENMGGVYQILAPNAGFLSFVCDFGVIGIFFMFVCLSRNMLPAILPVNRVDVKIKSISFLGTVLFFQSFVFSAGLLPIAWGVLLAAGFIRGNNERSCQKRKYNC